MLARTAGLRLLLVLSLTIVIIARNWEQIVAHQQLNDKHHRSVVSSLLIAPEAAQQGSVLLF